MKRVVANMKAPCNCKVCSKKFPYDGLYSPMLNEDRWEEVVSFYDLQEYEKEAFERECSLRRGTNVFNYPDAHLFICKECMEKALGRELTLSDVNDSLFNIEFIKQYENNR